MHFIAKCIFYFSVFSADFENHPKKRRKKFWAVNNNDFHKATPPSPHFDFINTVCNKKNEHCRNKKRKKFYKKSDEKSRCKNCRRVLDKGFFPFHKNCSFCLLCMLFYVKTAVLVNKKAFFLFWRHRVNKNFGKNRRGTGLLK